jgi:biotin/methionine sulfoxide reductase
VVTGSPAFAGDDNNEILSQNSKVAGLEAAAINPQDAAAHGIVEGDVVRVFNDRGACLAGATITEAVCRGVLRLACGAWYDPEDGSGNALCANVLTHDQGASKLGQGAKLGDRAGATANGGGSEPLTDFIDEFEFVLPKRR